MGIIEQAKDIADLVRKYNDIELTRKIVELEGQIVELSRENHRLVLESDAVKAIQSLRAKVVFEAPYYYLEGDRSPLCPGCWDGTGKTVHLMRTSPGRSTLQCPVCKTFFCDT